MLKNHINRIYLIFISLLISSFSYGQSCIGFHREGDCKIFRSDGFETYGQSRSAMLEIKKEATFKAVFYGQRDYKVVLCTEKGYYPVHFVILNAETKEIFYDNFEDDYTESVGFTMDKTQNLIFNITVLAEDVKPEASIDIRVCVGVNIYWRKVPKLGF